MEFSEWSDACLAKTENQRKRVSESEEGRRNFKALEKGSADRSHRQQHRPLGYFGALDQNLALGNSPGPDATLDLGGKHQPHLFSPLSP